MKLSRNKYRIKRPWDHEPDRVEFKYNGYDCLILRNKTLKTLRGYVAVSFDHKFYGKNYSEISADVHGGITYADCCFMDICRTPNNCNDNIWWLGFDCAHGQDYIPGFNDLKIKKLKTIGGDPKNYKTIDFVKNELQNLIRQL